MSRGTGEGRGCNRFPRDSTEKDTQRWSPQKATGRGGGAAAVESKGGDHGGREGHQGEHTMRKDSKVKPGCKSA